ncbi:MAG: hypothetical protein CO150_05430 [Nitrospirae bacterium CG_4_9_14_3_um_filter_53_35]|nr:MAG: hypothetical protein AUK29_09895 [Nitrospirae bacterium CG2_30_53_67]PIS37104.1 MAG: hypothetical protein COT35_07650 [Nitrospirae bacterium CG08_land_8_20_14_0_20_52_24]PIV82793.1 MAG: hypothetical protein COW52_11505 [Nitrospirae bacterium CG17_big_fil_post_rev_8_21_14_2_50_50_9]PIW84964.1 MAG: hypothetical protein COZ95_06985 [Nitrospirae bacterium CG_4_8_14_3_um_filter_50_41]PIX85480.1 MAG: hypothetical protein COZ32_08260 [Nitrospirae bacterium CG_4_10_14_3_um_filter_53_41]PJA7511
MKKIVFYLMTMSLAVLFAIPLYAGSDSSAGSGPASPSGVTAPGTILLDSLSRIYEPVNFNHEMHTSIAEHCSQCHHQHPSAKEVTCMECHSLTASDFKKSAATGFIACRSCHEAIDPAQPNMPGLKAAYHRACFRCHRDMGDAGLDPQSCSMKCHAKKKG